MQQIAPEELKKKIQQARDAGIPEEAIASRVKLQFGQDITPISKPTVSTPAPTAPDPTIPTEPPISDDESLKQKFENNFLVGPAVKYAGTLLESVKQLKNLAKSNAYRKSILGQDLTPEEAEEVVKIASPTYMSEKQLKTTVEKPVETAVKNVAGMSSYVIPAGKTLTTAVALGAGAGTLRGLSEENATPESVLGSTIGGGTAGGLFWGGGKIIGKARDIIKGSAKTVSKRAAQDLLQANGTAYKNAAQSGIDPRQLVEKYGVVGNYDELVGPIEQEYGGVIQEGIRDAEKVIQTTVKKSGAQKIDLQPVLNQLEAKKIVLGQIPGNETKLKAINTLIAGIKAKGKAISLDEALTIKRASDEAFGKAIMEDTTGASLAQGQKIIANTLRGQIKTQFPEIGEALTQEHELIILRNLLKDAQAKGATQGLGLGRFDITRPATLIEPLTKSPEITSRLAQGQGAKAGVPITENAVDQAMKTGVIKATKKAVPQVGAVVGSTIARGMSADPFKEPVPQLPSDLETQDVKDVAAGIENESATDDERRAKLAYLMWTYPKQAAQIKSVYETMYGSLKAKADKALPASQVTELADISSSIDQMSTLDISKYSTIMGPVQGRSRALNPYDTEAQAFQADMVLVAQNVGKALEGGVLRQEDTKKYLKILPQISDTPEIAKRKIDNVVRRLKNKQKAREDFYKKSGYSISGGVVNPADYSVVPATPEETTLE